MASPYDRRQYRRNRALVLEAAGWRCQVAGCQARATTADHIIPVVMGGTNDLANLRAACRHCNSQLGAVLTNERRRWRRLGRSSKTW